MDALMAALLVAALAQLGERTPRLAAVLADRWSPLPVIVGAALALMLVYVAGAEAAGLAAPRLSPNAALILLALALLLAAGGLVTAPKPPDRLERWQLGGFATALLGVAILAFGDAAQFVAAALALRSPVPALAGLGAALGAAAVIAGAALAGEAGWQRLPLRPMRLGAAALLGVAGIYLGLSGARLV